MEIPAVSIPNKPNEKSFCVLIPAYNPTAILLKLVEDLRNQGIAVVVVNDGSDLEVLPIFQELERKATLDTRLVVLHHHVNLGKGAALKTGLNDIAVHWSHYQGIVTADADGQHVLEDIIKVGDSLTAHPIALVLGVRTFDLVQVPWRSRFGNTLTRKIFNWVTGLKLQDTQTGLRGIPMAFCKTYLSIPTNHYEFELDMLLISNQSNYTIIQVPIQSVYIDGNKSSHFNPLLDSMRIYFVLFRFILASLLAALIDYVIFMGTYWLSQNLLLSQYSARLISGAMNYTMNKKGVFANQDHVKHSLPKYVLLALVLAFCSYLLIEFLVYMLSIPVFIAKPMAEGLLFMASFSIQRSFVFVKA